MAQKVNVYCGNLTMPWREFSIAIVFAQQINLLKCLAISESKGLTHQEQLCLLFMVSNSLGFQSYREVGFDLFYLLACHRCAEASDPRDKVFALLGLSRKSVNQEAIMVPDYNLDTLVVFENLTKRDLELALTLDILSVPKPSESSLYKSLPSWVPDWSEYKGGPILVNNCLGDYVYPFEATRNSTIRSSLLSMTVFSNSVASFSIKSPQ
jgi:hypothetical protein